MTRDDTWETTEDLNGEDGTPVPSDTTVALLEGADDNSQRRLVITVSGLVLVVKPKISDKPTPGNGQRRNIRPYWTQLNQENPSDS